MMQVVPIKCPNCQEMVTHLAYWATLDDEAVNLCENCVKINLFSMGEMFRIGFHYGYQKHRQELKDFLK